MKEHQIQHVCEYMGHTFNVHKQHYRNTSGFIERVNIGKLMVLQDLNLVRTFKGKPLDDIQFKGRVIAATNYESIMFINLKNMYMYL